VFKVRNNLCNNCNCKGNSMTDMVTASAITRGKHKCIPACRITPL